MKFLTFLRARRKTRLKLALNVTLSGLAMAGCAGSQSPPRPEVTKSQGGVGRRTLTHEETLRWIDDHRAWRQARKTRPIWARPIEREEVGKEFQTADHIKEVARAGFWLCVGVAGEPWFQTHEKIEAKYEPDGEEPKTLGFDTKSHT
jgi:hypothetical protein